MPAFTGLPRRWGVERPSAGMGRYRRLSQSDEDLPERRAATLSGAMSRLRLRWLARQAPFGVPRPQRQGRRGLARTF